MVAIVDRADRLSAERVPGDIPKVIHQVWLDAETPAETRARQQGWRTQHPDWSYRLWDLADIRALLNQRYPGFFQVFDDLPGPLARSNAARYFVLHHAGGVCVDAESECLGRVDSLVIGQRLVLALHSPETAATLLSGHPHASTPISSILMASTPQHPFWMHVGQMLAADPLAAADPLLLTQALAAYHGSESLSLAPADLWERITRIPWESNLSAGNIGGRPIPQAAWEAEYRSGRWDYLHSLPEMARYYVIASYASFTRPSATILDVGCGDGWLLTILNALGFASYQGIDFSSEAISRARALHIANARLTVADMETWTPLGLFDVIVFNESLYYARQPIRAILQYAHWLTPHGALIVSMHRNAESPAIWDAINAFFETIDATIVQNDGNVWEIRLLRPLAK